MVRSRSGACVVVALLTGCGGESRYQRDAPDVSASGGAPPLAGAAGSGVTLPTKDGIPVGDCTEPSASELTRDGCPVNASDGGACAATQAGVVCRYAIETQPEFTSAVQSYAVCLDGRWVPGAQRCSDMCRACLDGISAQRFDTSDCATRALLACPADPSVVPRPTAQNLMDDELERLVESCGPKPLYSPGAEIDFENGCPAALLTATQVDPGLVACLVSKLTSVRYECAVPLPCSFWSDIAI
jgi:hypothetical protein